MSEMPQMEEWLTMLMLCKLQLHRDQKGTHVTSRREENADLLFLSRGIVRFEFLEQSRKVMLASWREAVLGIIPHVRPDAWILPQDSVPTRETFSVWKLMASNKTIPELYQPPHSPYLAQCYFWLIPKQKTVLKGHRFQTLLIFRHIMYGDHPEEQCQKGGSRSVWNSGNSDSLRSSAAQGDTFTLAGTIIMGAVRYCS